MIQGTLILDSAIKRGTGDLGSDPKRYPKRGIVLEGYREGLHYPPLGLRVRGCSKRGLSGGKTASKIWGFGPSPALMRNAAWQGGTPKKWYPIFGTLYPMKLDRWGGQKWCQPRNPLLHKSAKVQKLSGEYDTRYPLFRGISGPPEKGLHRD